MHSELVKYQEDNVNRLVRSVVGELELETDQYKVLLDAPTGAGKTVMLAAMIEETVRDAARLGIGVAFLWLSPGTGGLEDQSAGTLRRELDGAAEINVFDLDPVWAAGYETFSPGDVGVVSWEAIHSTDKQGDFKNRLTRDGEHRNLFDLLDATRLARTRLVIVIDEAHHAVGGEGSADQLLADITRTAGGAIEVHATATPKRSAVYDESFRVDREEVVRAGVVARTIYVNEGTAELGDAADARHLVLAAGYDRLKQIAAAFSGLDIPIQPLLLVQLPDGRAGDEARDEVELFFREQGITTANGRLAVWLDKEKAKGVDRIGELDSPIQVLLFKQAIAKGWDCPRAYVLVRLRSTKSVTFDIQTIGRICRQPERIHYQSELLDNAFIYTDTDQIKLEEHLREGMGSEVEPMPQVAKLLVEVPEIIGAVPPPQTRPTLEDEFFAEKFKSTAEKAGLAKAIVWEEVRGQILTGAVPYADLKAGRLRDFGEVDVALSANQTQAAFDAGLRSMARPYQNRSSVEAIRKAVYSFLHDLRDNAPHTDMQNAALATPELFQAVKAAVDSYKAARPEDGAVSYRDAFPEELIHSWRPAPEIRYGHKADTVSPPRYAYSLRAVGRQSGPETEFEKALLKLVGNKALRWWWKNGDRGREYFAVPYRWKGGWHLFYPDYLVMWSDAVLGIYETKSSGDPIEPTASKAAGLAKWLKERWSENESVEYGIAVEYPDHGGWYINDGISYSEPPKASPDHGGGWVQMTRME